MALRVCYWTARILKLALATALMKRMLEFNVQKVSPFFQCSCALFHIELSTERCVDGAFRLVGNASTNGIVEVCKYESWWTVCGNPSKWTTHEAGVVCQELGFPRAGT